MESKRLPAQFGLTAKQDFCVCVSVRARAGLPWGVKILAVFSVFCKINTIRRMISRWSYCYVLSLQDPCGWKMRGHQKQGKNMVNRPLVVGRRKGRRKGLPPKLMLCWCTLHKSIHICCLVCSFHIIVMDTDHSKVISTQMKTKLLMVKQFSNVLIWGVDISRSKLHLLYLVQFWLRAEEKKKNCGEDLSIFSTCFGFTCFTLETAQMHSSRQILSALHNQFFLFFPGHLKLAFGALIAVHGSQAQFKAQTHSLWRVYTDICLPAMHSSLSVSAGLSSQKVAEQ